MDPETGQLIEETHLDRVEKDIKTTGKLIWNVLTGENDPFDFAPDEPEAK